MNVFKIEMKYNDFQFTQKYSWFAYDWTKNEKSWLSYTMVSNLQEYGNDNGMSLGNHLLMLLVGG